MENDDIVKHRALADLVRIADMMEANSDSDNPAFMRELKRDYRMAMKNANIGANKDKSLMWSAKEIAESRNSALAKATEYLDNIQHWAVELPKQQFGQAEYIVLSVKTNYSGMACETNLEIGSFMYPCYKARKSLVMQKQLASYTCVEQGLIKFALELCKTREEKISFFNKYALPYNERVKKEKEDGGI